MSPAKEESMEPVNLAEGGGEGDEAKADAAPADATPSEVVDPWAVDEATANDAAAATPTDEEQQPPSDTSEAINKLKTSSHRLASNLDQKLNISGAWSALGNSVKQIDQQTHVSKTVKSGASGIGSWFSTVDQKFQITEKGKEIGSSIGSIVPTQDLSTGLQKSTRAIQNFDESHKITASVTSTLADGANLLASTIGGSQDAGTGEAAAAASDQVNDVDKDGLPSSFQN